MHSVTAAPEVTLPGFRVLFKSAPGVYLVLTAELRIPS
jgi:hypothetical protein